MNLADIELILATDCGSTTTKARLFRKINGEYRYVISGEAPTTVEAPYEDVTMGVRNAVREIEELTGLKLLTEEKIRVGRGKDMVNLYVTTSSAGGGLQMMVFGVAKSITGESAERAALGAGAIVMDVLTTDDGIPIPQKITRIRFLRPDIILFAGGTDGGNVPQVTEIAELIKSAEPKARFGLSYSLPIIFAGNNIARPFIQKYLEEKFSLQIVDNIRPEVGIENTIPTRDAIHEAFMEHVMSHAPGYDTLMKWTDVPIMPTPMGEGLMFQLLAERRNMNVIGVGLGGATTNIYSVYDKRFVRTVSANLGMSYSICNVLKEAGIDNIRRWIPFYIDNKSLENFLANKMIRPTVVPQSLKTLLIEHAVAREAIRLGFQHHRSLARGLRGVQREVSIADVFERKVELESYIKLLNVRIIGGTGGLLSHAPRRIQSALLLMDSFQPEGVTRLVQDSVFMIPHLGVLSTVHSDAAYEIFDKDCLIRLGTSIAPRGVLNKGEHMFKIELNMPDGQVVTENVNFGEIKRIQIEAGREIDAIITPDAKCDVGAGNGRSLPTTIEGGAAGIILDGRGRPLILSELDNDRIQNLLEWYKNLDMYPLENIEE